MIYMVRIYNSRTDEGATGDHMDVAEILCHFPIDENLRRIIDVYISVLTTQSLAIHYSRLKLGQNKFIV